MRDLANRFLSARRKGWLRTRPVVTDRNVPTAADLSELAARVGCSVPDDMREWLAIVGFCTIDDDLNFQPVWFRRIDEGHLSGAIFFAQDTLGNFYGFVPADRRIVCFSRSEPGCATLAVSFLEFLECLEARDYKILDWVDSMPFVPYEWAAV
jgi:hypothetical protein